MICAGGLIAGLIIANLLCRLYENSDYRIPLTIITNILFGSLGVFLALSKRNENILEDKKRQSFSRKVLDTSVIIDGRIWIFAVQGYGRRAHNPRFVLEN